MPNPLNLTPLLNTPMTDPKTGLMSLAWQQYFILLEQRSGPTLTQQGQLQATAPIVGRDEGIGTTVQNISDTGNLDSLAHVDNANTDLLTDGTGSPLAGGKRGFIGFSAVPQLASSFIENPVNVSSTPTGATGLSNDGVSHVVVVSASTQQFGAGQVNYNSGSFDPGSFGSFFAFADDPQFDGGAVTYQSSTSPVDITAADGRVPFGGITTASGSSNTGGGNSGGTTGGGGAGGRGFNQL